jgi:hypothetical protein
VSRYGTFLLVLSLGLAPTAAALSEEPPPTPTPAPAAGPSPSPQEPTPAAPEPAPAVPETPPPALELTPPPAPTPTLAGAAPQQASNVLNPNISLVGNLVGFSGGDRSLPDRAFDLSELELGIQAPIDPYARADAFIAFTPEGIDIEEGYVTFLTLARSFNLKVGKFRSNFGKFNRTHPPETPFADRPIAAERFFGEEGLAAVGLSGSYLVPTAFYLNLDAEITTIWDEAPLFGKETEEGEVQSGGRRGDLGYLFRASTYADFSEQTNGTLGVSVARGVHDSEGELASDALGVDFTLRWKDPRRAIYRSFIWQTEGYFTRREEDFGRDDAFGAFSYAEFQFARRWRVGLRGDYVESPEEKGALAYLTFWPSEFSALSAQARLIRRPDGRDDYAGFLKLTFNIGPHGAHPF